MSVFGNITLSLLKRVAEKDVKHPCGFLGIRGGYCDKSASLRTHSRAPHHLRLVFTKSLRALKRVFFSAEL